MVSTSNVQCKSYLVEYLYQQANKLAVTNLKLPRLQWPELVEKRKMMSLRQLANEYGVSHETVRRILAAAQKGNTTISLG